MEIRHIRAFVAVAEELNFTRAAERLFVAQQALSNQIRQLEDEIGTKLFTRTTRRVEITPAGDAFHIRAIAILDSLDEAKEVARRVGLGDSGHLELAYTHSLGIESLPAIVDQFHEDAPSITLTAAVTLTDQAVFGLLRGQFDLVVVRNPELPDGVCSVTIRREPAGVILSTRHPFASKEVVDVEDLEASTLVIWPRWHSPGYVDKILDAFPQHRADGRVRVYETFTHDGFLADKASYVEISHGQAFQVAFESQYRPVPEGFVWRPLHPQLTISVDVLFRDGPLTATQQRFIDAAMKVSREHGWMHQSPTIPSRGSGD